MPIYEYRCDDCGRTSEALQRVTDPPLTECAECGGRLRKQISAPAFQFKGSGWYVTDYAKKPAAGGDGAGKGESGAAAKDDGGGGAAGESKQGAGEPKAAATSSSSDD